MSEQKWQNTTKTDNMIYELAQYYESKGNTLALNMQAPEDAVKVVNRAIDFKKRIWSGYDTVDTLSDRVLSQYGPFRQKEAMPYADVLNSWINSSVE